MEEEQWEGESWKCNHGGIKEGFGGSQDSPRGTHMAFRVTQKPPRRHPGDKHLKFSPLVWRNNKLINKLSKWQYGNRVLVIVYPPCICEENSGATCLLWCREEHLEKL